MKITKLRIINFKKLNIEKMDFEPNKNSFKNNGNYHEGKKITPKVIGIAGSNASGKTSIIIKR